MLGSSPDSPALSAQLDSKSTCPDSIFRAERGTDICSPPESMKSIGPFPITIVPLVTCASFAKPFAQQYDTPDGAFHATLRLSSPLLSVNFAYRRHRYNVNLLRF